MMRILLTFMGTRAGGGLCSGIKLCKKPFGNLTLLNFMGTAHHRMRKK
jgi:hypothetical protein